MTRWDAISWWATGIFVLGAALAAATQNDAFLFLMIGSYMLRPTLYAMGIATKYSDERQMSIQYRSGNLALTIVIAAIIAFAIKARMEGKPADDFYVLLIVALAARALVGVLMLGDHKAVGVRISVGVGSLLLLFALAQTGFTLRALPEAAPGILILLLGLLGKRMPRISGGVFAILAVVAFYFIGFRTGHGLTFSQVITALLVSLPLAISAFCFLKGARQEGKGTPAE
jgi:hypothetical protein